MHKWFRPAVVLPVAVVVGLLIALGSGLRQQARGATPFGFATIGMHAPSGAQTIGASFSMQGRLDAFTPGSSDSWAGYDFELAYDSSILQIDSDTNGLCSASGWGLVTTTPHLVTGCAFQSSTSTGVLENITAHCIASGTSPLTLVPRNDPSSTQVGTALFDVNGNDFTMTLNNASVTCGNAVPPTATSTATATNTPTVTSTPTDTATPTPTATSTDTSTPTTPTATNTPRPTRTPLPGPVVLNGEWAPFSRCPVDSATMLAVDGHTAIDYCVAARSTAGSIKLGNSTSTTGGSDMQFGLSGLNPWTISLPQDGAILADPVDVPGGLLGLMCPSLDPVVTSVCNLATDNDLNRVTAAVESAGPLTDFDINAGLQVGAPIATLPIKVHLENPLLGSTCYIGSDADPIVLHPANIDLSHSSFSVVRFDADGTDDTQGPLQVVKLTGTTQGDSQFAVPAASGCGAAGALNTAINTKEGLPSPAGNNSIVLTNSSTYLASFTNSGDFYPYAGFDFSDDWHSAICPCATPTATNTPILPTLTVLPTITAIPTIGAGSCQGDTDCDGCGDTAELALKPPTDPLDPWDFYSVPVPALLVLPQPAGVVRDRVVASSDAEAVFAYFKAGAHTGNTAYEQDLNQNGVKDGVEYDRSVMGPGQSGAPDGTVSASDAELAFAQFRLNYRC